MSFDELSLPSNLSQENSAIAEDIFNSLKEAYNSIYTQKFTELKAQHPEYRKYDQDEMEHLIDEIIKIKKESTNTAFHNWKRDLAWLIETHEKITPKAPNKWQYLEIIYLHDRKALPITEISEKTGFTEETIQAVLDDYDEYTEKAFSEYA